LTLIEVLVVFAVIFILAMLLLPMLNRGGHKSYLMQCMNNMAQLQLCWEAYAEDHNGTLVRNEPSDPASWVTGNMKTASGATNLADLTNGLFFPYASWSPPFYKCPAAKGPTPSGLDGSLLVRTVSMTPRMGNYTDKDGLIAPAPPVLKMTDITNPAPANAAVFVDESVATVGDGFFAMDNVAKQMAFRNSPTLRHPGRATVSFADGHASQWIFTSESNEPFPRTVLPFQSNDWRQVYDAIYPPPP